MRTTIDIPDETYRKLKVKAALEGETVRQIVLRGILREIGPSVTEPAQRVMEPIPRSFAPGSLRIEKREQPPDVKKLEIGDQSGQAPQKQFELPVIRSTRPRRPGDRQRDLR